MHVHQHGQDILRTLETVLVFLHVPDIHHIRETLRVLVTPHIQEPVQDLDLLHILQTILVQE